MPLDLQPGQVDSDYHAFNKKLMWVGYCVMGKQQSYFQHLRMYEEPPHSRNIVNTSSEEMKVADADRALNRDLRLSQIKEHDLLLLSEKVLDLKGFKDIKKVATIEWLRAMILRPDTMLALVTTKASAGGAGNSLISLNCAVDVSKSFYLQMAEEGKSYSKFYVYHLESLGVSLREYKTIRMSEFYGMVDTLLKPQSF